MLSTIGRATALLSLAVLSSIASFSSATETEEDQFGFGAFRSRSFGPMESYDPYTQTVNFTHYDGSVKSSQSLQVDFIRRLVSPGQNHGNRLANWNLTFGHVYTPGFGTGNVCDEVLGKAFVTQEGLVKQFYATVSKGNMSSSVSGLVSKDGWQAFCWPALGGRGNPRGRDEVVFQSPDGKKFIIGKQIYWDFGWTGETDWVVTRVESSAGDGYDINYTEQRLEYGDKADRVFYVSSIDLSDGTKIEFSYLTEHLKTGTKKKYDAFVLDKIKYNSRVLVDYDYIIRNSDYSAPLQWLELSRVNLPEGKNWTYTPEDLVNNKSYSFVSPEGVTGTYQGNGVTNKAGKITYSGSFGSQVLDFSSDIKSRRLVATVVKAANSCKKYYYWSVRNLSAAADIYKRGAQKAVEIYADNGCSNLLERTSFDYTPIKLSDTDEVSSYQGSKVSYPETRVPVLVKKTIERFHSSGTDIFVTEYANFDKYLNPQTITETYSAAGFPSNNRITRRTYLNDTTNWVLGLVATETTDGIAGTLTNSYQKGQLISSNKFGVTHRIGYDSKGNVATTTDALGKVTYYSNYLKGVARTITGPEGYAESRVVDPFGNVTAQTKWGDTTTFGYDNLDRLTSVNTPSPSDFNNVIGYTKNSEGLRQTVTRGFNISDSQYNELGQLIWQRDTVAGVTAGTPTATTQYYRYDAAGNRIFASYPNSISSGTTTAYDALGRVTAITQSDNARSTLGYLAGNRVKVTDAQGNYITNTYLSWGNPGEAYLNKTEQPATSGNPSVILSPAISTDIGRNKLGLIDYVRQGGLTQNYGYTSTWQLDYVTTPETGKTDYNYDANGNLIAKQMGTDTSTLTRYHYDGLNRLKRIDYPAPAADVDYQYNSKGQLDWVRKGTTQWTYGYTANGVMKSESLTDSLSSKTWTFGYGIDSYDHVASLTYSNGNVISYNPDTAGRPTKAGSIAANIRYHASGALAGLTFGNGRVYSVGLDSRQRPSNFDVDHSVMDLTYTYYQDNNIKSITDHQNSGNSIAMQYDQHQRLRQVTGAPWGSGALSYDATGNIKTNTIGGLNLAYSYNATTNRLDTVSGSKPYTFGYDTYGNVTSNGTFTFTYDDDGSMIDAHDNNSANLFSYSYDAYNRRFKETKNGALEKFSVYSSTGQLLLEEDKDGYQTNFVYAAGQRLAAIADCPNTDTDKDKILDCDEKQMGFDPADPTDGAGDYDGDGLSNAYEFNNGLNMRNADTDGDGMVDGWEVRNGLNPKVNDAYSDKDGDGLTNLQEYVLGTAANKVDTDGDGIRDNVDDQPLFNLAAFIPVMMLILN